MPYSVQFNVMHDGLTGHVNVTISDGVNSADDKTFGANVNTFSLGVIDLSVTEIIGANGELGVQFRAEDPGATDGITVTVHSIVSQITVTVHFFDIH